MFPLVIDDITNTLIRFCGVADNIVLIDEFALEWTITIAIERMLENLQVLN